MVSRFRNRWFRSAAVGVLLIGSGAVAGVAQATPATHARATLVSEAGLVDGVRVNAPKDSDVLVTKLIIGPGGSTGWHTHRATVIVMVDKGTASFYYADDPRCRAHRYGTGEAVSETPGRVHITRNEGRKPLKMTVVFLVPPNGNSGVDEPQPRNCSF